MRRRMENAKHHPSIRRLLWALVLCAAFGIFAAATAHAQLGDFKIASASYEYYPYAETEETDLSPGGSEVAFQNFRANVTLPIELDGKNTILIPALKYSLLDIVERDGEGNAPESSVEALHAIMLKTSLYQRFDEDWAMFASIGGGLASDFGGDLGGDDWVVSGQLIGLWTIVPEFTLGAGVGYDRRTGDVTPLPLLAVSWQPSERFMLRGIVPESLAARYRAVQWLTLGVEGALEGERYHLSGLASPQSADAGSPDVEDAEVAYSVGKVGLAATAHLQPSLHARVYGGAALHRRFEVYVDDDSQGDLRVATAPYIGIELFVGPSGWREDQAQRAPEPVSP